MLSILSMKTTYLPVKYDIRNVTPYTIARDYYRNINKNSKRAQPDEIEIVGIARRTLEQPSNACFNDQICRRDLVIFF